MLELIQSDYYEEIGKTNFAKDLREDNNEDLEWMYEFKYRRVGVGGRIGRIGGVGGVGFGGRIGGVGVGVVGVGVGDFGVGVGN